MAAISILEVLPFRNIFSTALVPLIWFFIFGTKLFFKKLAAIS